MMVADFETILYKEEDNISYLCINMPPANKMIPKFFEEITIAIEKYVIETKSKAVIVYGEGRHFSSGADIEQLLDFVVQKTDYVDDEIKGYPEWYIKCKKAFISLFSCDIPVISLVRGFCIGSGFELALSTHIRISEKNARIALPELTFGLLPGVNATLRTCEEICIMNAFDFILRGELITGEEAFEKNLVNCVVGKNESFALAKKFIDYLEEENIEYNRKYSHKIFSNFLNSKND